VLSIALAAIADISSEIGSVVRCRQRISFRQSAIGNRQSAIGNRVEFVYLSFSIVGMFTDVHPVF
jgi:hypothetical protein